MKRIQSQVVEVTVSGFNSSGSTTCGTVQKRIDFTRDGTVGAPETATELTETEKSRKKHFMRLIELECVTTPPGDI